MLNAIGVIVAFIVIILLIRKRFNFGLSLLIGSVIIGLFSLQIIEILDIPKAFISGSIYSFQDQQIQTDTVELALLMVLIYILAKCMQETGAITKLIHSLQSFFSKGGILGIIPAIYGLMPVPGGALFSAPLIDKEGESFKLKQTQKNFLNVWFRHIWFPIYPISSAMATICSQEFANINIYELIIANIPSFLGFIIIGYLFLNYYTKPQADTIVKSEKDYRGLLYLLIPVVPIFYYVSAGLGAGFAYVRFVPSSSIFEGFTLIRPYQISIFVLGLVTSIFLLYCFVDIEPKKYFELIKTSVSFKLALAIFGIMIFREMFDISGVNVIILDVMNGLAFPSLVIIILIPLILGLLTGYNLGAIALSYFIVEPFFQTTGINHIGLTSLVFISSLVGYLISPIHLCNVLSSDYLKTDTTRMYKMFIPASLCLLVIQIVFLLFFYTV